MFEKLLDLFERLVVAHETIAANTAASGAALNAKNATVDEKTPVAEKPKSSKKEAKPVQENEQPTEDKPKRGRKKAAEPDNAALRAEVEEWAQEFAACDDDEVMDEFKKLLEDFDVRTVKKVADEDLPDFHKAMKELFDEFFEAE